MINTNPNNKRCEISDIKSIIKINNYNLVGDVIEFGLDLVKIGTTSITIACDVRNKKTKESIIKIDEIVFVLLDGNGKPYPHGKTRKTIES